jgi:hypothetical protein
VGFCGHWWVPAAVAKLLGGETLSAHAEASGQAWHGICLADATGWWTLGSIELKRPALAPGDAWCESRPDRPGNGRAASERGQDG